MEWRDIVTVPVYKVKGGIQDCCYRERHMMSHTMHNWERIIT